MFDPARQVTGQLFAKIAAGFEFAGVRHQLDAQPFDRDAQLESAQAVLDQPDGFTAPAIRAESSAQLAFDVDAGQRREQIPDWLDGIGIDRRAASASAIRRVLP